MYRQTDTTEHFNGTATGSADEWALSQAPQGDEEAEELVHADCSLRRSWAHVKKQITDAEATCIDLKERAQCSLMLG